MTSDRRSRRKKVWILVSMGVLLITGIVTFRYFQTLYYAMGTAKRMTIITLALENYRAEHGHYPPQYLTDEHGKPIHSWRVLILPYLVRYDDLYGRYRFDEPWDAAHNRLLAKEIPFEYRAPCASSESNVTQYLAIGGNHAAWQGMKRMTPSALLNGNVDVVWFVENAGSDVNWMEPRDIPLEKALTDIPSGKGTVRSYYSRGLPAEKTQSHFSWIPVGISRSQLKKMLIIPKRENDIGKGEKDSPVTEATRMRGG